MSESPRAPWFGEGLRFECQPDCAACCVDHGDYTHVYLSEDDVERLARHFELTVGKFKRRYTGLEDGYRILKMSGPDCPFLEDRRCSVYDARPKQCRTFPFWEENVRSRHNWRRLAAFCPGIDRGPVHTLLQIRDQVEESSGS